MSPIIVKKDIKHINLRVKPNLEVIMSVPFKTTDKHIEYVLNKRSDWIKDKLAFYKLKPAELKKEYVSGENCAFLGKNYRLKVIQSSKEEVKLKGGYLNLFVKNTNNFQKKKYLLEQWYKDKAQYHIQKAFKKYQVIVKKDVAKIRIRKMKARWGSCNPQKSYINLNVDLIKTQTRCIEYVVFHELTHLIYPNHDKNFYNYLSLHMPNWQKIKNKLEGFE
jgi:predicted metal-dependent hydrolase